MHGPVVVEIVFQEVLLEKYQEMFVSALRDRCKRQLTNEQLEVLKPVIQQAQETGLPPVDLAMNLAENWEAIF